MYIGGQQPVSVDRVSSGNVMNPIEENKQAPLSEEARKIALLYRSVSILLWAIPLYLIFAVQTVFTDDWKVLFLGRLDMIGILPTTCAAAAAMYGMILMKRARVGNHLFQREVGFFVWYLGVITVLSPFFYWFSQAPGAQILHIGRYVFSYFGTMVFLLCFVLLYSLIVLSGVVYKLVGICDSALKRNEAGIFMIFNSLVVTMLMLGLLVYHLIVSGVIAFWRLQPLCFYFGPQLHCLFVLGVLVPTAVSVCWLWHVRNQVFQKILKGELELRDVDADAVKPEQSEEISS